MAKMYCKKCGTRVKKDYTFCPICGAMTKVRVSRKADVDQDVLSNAVKQLKEGNEEGFSLIYFHTYKFVYNRAKYLLNDEQEAHDLTQDVYMALYKGIDEINDEKAIYGWLKTVVFRQGLKFIEKNRKCEVVSEDAEFLFDTLPDDRIKIEDSYGRKEDVRTVKKCIELLSEEQRLVVMAYYYDNMGVKEIAKALGISEGTVKSRLYLARKRLLTMLQAEEEKQGYKFFGAGLPLIMPALNDTLKINEKIAKDAILANYKNFCGQAGIEETPALLKTTGIAGKTAAMVAGMSFKKIIITIASFIVVGATCGALLVSGGNEVNDILAGAKKTGKEVVLSKEQEKKSVKSTENSETTETVTDTADSQNNQTASETDQTASDDNQNNSENGTTRGDTTADETDRTENKPVDLTTVSGLRYNIPDNSNDVNLTWAPVEGADGYEVYVATSEFPNYKKDSTVNTTKCTVLTGGSYYHIKVRAYSNQNGKKVYGPFCGEISTEPKIVFPQQIDITRIWQEGMYVVVSVDQFKVDYHAEVELYRSTSANGGFQRVGSVKCSPGYPVTVSQVTDVHPNDDQQTYYYKVRIKAFKTWQGKSDKYSSYSNVMSYKYDLDGEAEEEEEVY